MCYITFMKQNSNKPKPNSSFITQNSTIIVGFSGGPDSVALLHMLHQMSKEHHLTLVAAHLNHGWQEKASEFALFCRNWCAARPNIIYEEQFAPDLKFEAKWNGSLEEVGRTLRRAWFLELAKKYNASAIALAHHAQDQHETFFLRLMRGSSLAGLVGMQAKDGLFIRPLLSWSKQDIMHYLQEHNLSYVTDPSNASDAYLRNRIRNSVLPACSATDARFEQNLSKTMTHLAQAQDFITTSVQNTLQIVSSNQGIELARFTNLHPYLKKSLVVHLLVEHQAKFNPSNALLEEILRFVKHSTTSKHQLLHGLVMHKNKTHFWFEKK